MKEGDFVYAVSENYGLVRGPIINFYDEEGNSYDEEDNLITYENCDEIEIDMFTINNWDAADYGKENFPKENVFTNIDDAIELFRKVESKRNK